MARAQGRPTGRAGPQRAPTSDRASAAARARPLLPAGPRQRRERAAPRPELRPRLLGVRRGDLVRTRSLARRNPPPAAPGRTTALSGQQPAGHALRARARRRGQPDVATTAVRHAALRMARRSGRRLPSPARRDAAPAATDRLPGRSAPRTPGAGRPRRDALLRLAHVGTALAVRGRLARTQALTRRVGAARRRAGAAARSGPPAPPGAGDHSASVQTPWIY